MVTILLTIGLACIALGLGTLHAEFRARLSHSAVPGTITGFSVRDGLFHPLAEFVALNGVKYYLEGSAGSQTPAGMIGNTVTVLVDQAEPPWAEIAYSSTFAAALMTAAGLMCAGVCYVVFQAGVFSTVVALLVLMVLRRKARHAWRKARNLPGPPREQLKNISAPISRVFTEKTKAEIPRANPKAITDAWEALERNNRPGVLLVLGLLLLLAGAYFYRMEEFFVLRAATAAGEVVDMAQNPGPRSTLSAVVRYADEQGRVHEFTDSLGSSLPFHRIGQNVRVLYNREDVTQVQIDRGSAGNYGASIGVCAFGMLCLYLSWSIVRRRRLRLTAYAAVRETFR